MSGKTKHQARTEPAFARFIATSNPNSSRRPELETPRLSSASRSRIESCLCFGANSIEDPVGADLGLEGRLMNSSGVRRQGASRCAGILCHARRQIKVPGWEKRVVQPELVVGMRLGRMRRCARV